MPKLNFLGIGPRIATVLLPWLVLTIVLSTHYKETFAFTPGKSTILMISGAVLLFIGLIFYGSTVRLLLKGLNETRLVTNGTYQSLPESALLFNYTIYYTRTFTDIKFMAGTNFIYCGIYSF